MPFSDFEIIYSYTRAQALDDGVLVDISAAAREYGFKLPTAVTDNLFHGHVVPPEGLEGEGQSVEGRLHDLLSLAMIAARRGMNHNRVEFEVLFLMRPGGREKVTVILHVGPGDQGEAVLTLMLPGDE
ncbi:hypothetical protein NNJEOMEG_00630 [Fundidesulfovibrio magnetotacticus]|uniref:Uncharacterized protein n=1 Tax=Fundidesulfovibrio magnetotacticus TaxID=2730080 RepID=A0A6V8LJA3_9BACT|nr:DUF6573 family protein [Fundidesulfovibrio magnetotacticus]GFK92803.1 hypothetical protein NNJEOMEG_00630 [Fundidesulfovibrio magnetotacticus]